MIYLTLELLWNKYILYKFLFFFSKNLGLVIYNFPILLLVLIFDREGTLLVDFFISQYDFGLGCERDFFSFSREEGAGDAPYPLPRESPLYNIFQKLYIYVNM